MSDIDTFLRRLSESSPYDVRLTRQLVSEARDHLRSAYEAHLGSGFPDETAQKLAIESFGDLSSFFACFREEGGPTYQEKSMSMTFLRVILGALTGILMTSFGLIDTSAGGVHFDWGGGNEWTPLLTGGGAFLGASLFLTPFIRRHLAVPLGASLGLASAILLRDTIQLRPLLGGGEPVSVSDFTPYQPPSDPFIIGLIFGLIALGAVAGFLIQITLQRRRRSTPRSNLPQVISLTDTR